MTARGRHCWGVWVIVRFYPTSYLLVSPADIIGFRGQTKCWSWSGSKLIDSLMVFLKFILENQQTTNASKITQHVFMYLRCLLKGSYIIMTVLFVFFYLITSLYNGHVISKNPITIRILMSRMTLLHQNILIKKSTIPFLLFVMFPKK